MEGMDIQSEFIRIDKILNPHEQMDGINNLLKIVYSRIEAATTINELRKITTEINKNREFLQSLLEIANITMSVSNADGPDYEKVVGDLNILADPQEFAIYISKYEVVFNTLERLSQFHEGVKTFLSLPFISADIKSKVRKVFDVLLEWVANPNENNWLSLLSKEISKKGSIDEKTIFLSQVLRTLGNELVEKLKAPRYHPHFPDEALTRAGPNEEHLKLAEPNLKRKFSTDQGLLNVNTYSLLYSDVNVGMNIILNFETFLKIQKRNYEEVMNFTTTVREIGQSYESSSSYHLQLKIKSIDRSTLSYTNPGIVFASDLSFKQATNLIIVFTQMYKVEKGNLVFTSLDLLTAHCE